MTWLLVALGAAVGAPLRYLTDRAVQARHDSLFPWGTLTVNLAGCLLLGVLAGASVTSSTYALLGTGLCGALSTYSTFSYETFRLAERGCGRLMAANAVVSVLVGLGSVAVGVELGQALTG
ncbi:fluoride efflux transporter FluC [Streptomyces albipurpureus]|uniref:Fluoride-specific ion channel FluC n=1 Tax=Streptomyces albipurpureus TaxID=2897419 RepID=A0ABT0UR83_9ACTN|nr:CrcB family protein [Streptomyces sp. CWNU-1]MCM2390930.1 CrcB family protein [Streptomyces sp. CWNU-1]